MWLAMAVYLGTWTGWVVQSKLQGRFAPHSRTPAPKTNAGYNRNMGSGCQIIKYLQSYGHCEHLPRNSTRLPTELHIGMLPDSFACKTDSRDVGPPLVEPLTSDFRQPSWVGEPISHSMSAAGDESNLG